MKTHYIRYISWVLSALAYTAAACALPFTIIAGLGLLIAVPFTYFAYMESGVREIIKHDKNLTIKMRSDRSKRIAACIAGLAIIFLLIWWSNSHGTNGDSKAASTALFKNLLWVVFIAQIMSLPQQLYRKR